MNFYTRLAVVAGMLLVVSYAASAPAPGQQTLEQAKAAGKRGDTVTAEQLYTQAAEQGNAEAQVYCGHSSLLSYALGKEASDLNAAMTWFRKAADQGDVDGELALANVFGTDLYGSRNDAEAFKWYKQAADAGSAEGQYKTGHNYEKGAGIPADMNLAIYWYKKAATQDNEIEKQLSEDALLRLQPPGNDPIRQALHDGLVAEDKNDSDAATAAYRRAAALGSAEGQERLAEQLGLYVGLSGVVEAANPGGGNIDNAAKCKEMLDALQKSTAQNYSKAMVQMANIYNHGWCVAKDKAEAKRWLEKAANLGNSDAKKRLKGSK